MFGLGWTSPYQRPTPVCRKAPPQVPTPLGLLAGAKGLPRLRWRLAPQPRASPTLAAKIHHRLNTLSLRPACVWPTTSLRQLSSPAWPKTDYIQVSPNNNFCAVKSIKLSEDFCLSVFQVSQWQCLSALGTLPRTLIPSLWRTSP